MSSLKQAILKTASGPAIATFMCRFLGLLRESMTAAVLGGGAVTAGWQLAFAMPNLFRRILGEGALGTALVPMIASLHEVEGTAAAKKYIAAVFAYLGLLLALIVIAVSGVSLAIYPFVDAEHWKIALKLTPVLMPYALFICLIGAFSAVLNSIRIFFFPALGALLFNSMMIVALSAAWYWGWGGGFTLGALSAALLLSGVIQLIFTAWMLHKNDMLPRFRFSDFKNVAALKSIWSRALPGMIGASAVSISFCVDRVLAGYIGPEAVPALTFSDRLIFLPIGIFAVSFGSVLLTDMSRAIAKGRRRVLIASLTFSLRILIYICIPMAVFIAFFRIPAIRLIFMHGRFTENNLQATAWAMLFYAAGIPAFAAVKVVATAFYARHDMATPVKVSFLCIFMNICLSLMLMFPLQQGGIALATVISSFLNNIILLWLLRREINYPVPVTGIAICSVKSIAAAAAAAGLLFWLYPLFRQRFGFMRGWEDLFPLTLTGILFVAVFILLSFLLRIRELPEIMSLLSPRRRKN